MTPELRDALDLTRSFVVEGIAGSGKSELGFSRYLVALEAVQHPEEVLYLVDDQGTVSRLRQRISVLLRDEPDGALAQQDAKLGWRLAEQPERLQIHTIGTLATALVKAAPVSSGCGAGSRLTATPDAYYRNAARALLRTLDHDERVAPNLETLLLHLDNDLVRAEKLLGGLLRRRASLQRCLQLDDAEANRTALQSGLQDAVEMTLTDCSATIPADVSDELVAIGGLAGKHLAMRGSESEIVLWRDLRSLPATDSDHLAHWRGLGELLLEDDGTLRKSFGPEQGIEDPAGADDAREREIRTELESRIEILVSRLQELPAFRSRLGAIRQVADVRYSHLQWTVLQSLLAVLPRVIGDLGRAFRALGEMDLTAMVQGAANALDAGQAEIFGPQGLQHVVVDNAHEMSFSALNLVERLTRNWSGTDERSLLIAGNSFASVCRTDGAQPALFLTVLNNGIGKCGLNMLSLTQQERSGSAIIEWVNKHFSHETDAVIGEGGMPFLSAVPQRDEAGEVSVDGVTGSFHAEAQAIVEQLKDKPQILEGQVAVLLGDGAGAAMLIDSLRRAGIRCHSEQVDLLNQRSVTNDLHALTRAICHLADRTAWLSVLRAPWCGLTLEDLHRLMSDSSEVAVWELIIDEQRRSQLSDDGQQRLSRIKRVMAQVLAERGQSDLRRLVEGAWTALGGAVCLRNEFEVEESRDFFRMLDQIDDGGEADSLEALDVAVAKLCAGGHQSRTDAAGSVLVTTIRQARQRSFDSVILAGLSTPVALPEDDDALRWLVRPDQFGKAQLLLAPVSGEGGGDEINRWVHSLQTGMHDNELRRLFYVGATRANDYLHVIARLPFAGDEWGAPPRHSLLSAMYRELHAELPERPSIVSEGEYATDAGIRRLPSNWLLPEAPKLKDWNRRETQARPGDKNPEGLGESAQLIAGVLRRTIGEIASLGAVDWAMRSLDGLENSLQQLFAMMGIPASDVSGSADRAGMAIRDMLEDERARWLFAAHESVHAPLQLTGWLDEKLVDADIDLSFVEDGTRWLVYFGFPELLDDPGDDPAAELAERLAARSSNAARLARGLQPMPIKTGLYLPYSRTWKEWSPGT
ncbi:MAG: hypothetical protein KJO54_00470 [Gammaproteobacteria bacterium]|nr:hypothetical protein [Gammaproteobacteria bacterium]